MRAFVCTLAMVLFWGGVARGVGFSEERAAGKRVTVCRVDTRTERLRLFLRDGHGEVFRRFDRLAQALRAKGASLVFAMNAGMFQPGWLPVGLFVADGKTLLPLNTTEGAGNFFLKPNGVFLVVDGKAQVVESSRYPEITSTGRVTLATQSGPLLVQAGTIHPAFNPASTSRLIRNGVGVTAAGEAVFAISEEPVNLYEFAEFFRDVLRCPDALFLDGTVSSLYAPGLKRDDFRAVLGPMIGVVE